MGVTPPSRDEVVFFATADELRAWLHEHHRTEEVLWGGFWKKATGRRSVTWPEAVAVALCFGWIDGVRYTLDEEAYTNRFTPRRSGSRWSRVNLDTFERLRDEGLVEPAGLAAWEARNPDEDEPHRHEQPEYGLEGEQLAALEAVPAAWAFWEAQPPSYRKGAAHWVTSAKRPETRERRLATLVEDCVAGRRIKPLRRPGEG